MALACLGMEVASTDFSKSEANTKNSTMPIGQACFEVPSFFFYGLAS